MKCISVREKKRFLFFRRKASYQLQSSQICNIASEIESRLFCLSVCLSVCPSFSAQSTRRQLKQNDFHQIDQGSIISREKGATSSPLCRLAHEQPIIEKKLVVVLVAAVDGYKIR